MASCVNPSADIASPTETRGRHTTKVGVLKCEVVDLIERNPVLHPVSKGSKASLSE